MCAIFSSPYVWGNTVLTAKAALLAAISAFGLTANASEKIAYWTFSETEGPVFNAQISENENHATAEQRHQGWIGYSPNISDDGEVLRNGSYARFNGQRNSIVLIDDTEHLDFNPGEQSFIISAHFSIDQSVLSSEALGPNQTWNLVQKGRFNNTGGQWKLQIRKNNNGRLFLQCLMNDDIQDTKKTSVQIALKQHWILREEPLKGRCELNRAESELRLELTTENQTNRVLRKATTLRTSFGAVAPQVGQCGSPNAFGGNIAIGNKPLCPDQKLDTDDAFRGKVYSLQIDRF